MLQLAFIKAQTPTLNCPSNITVFNNPGDCGAIVNYTIPTCATNCAGTTISQTDAAGLTSGDFFPVGITTLEYTINNGTESSTCTFDIEVIDNEQPTSDCVSQWDVYVNANCEYVVEDFSTAPFLNISDNCGVDVITQSPLPGTIISGVLTQDSIKLDISDIHGNSVKCYFRITLRDDTPPIINCPANQVEPITSGCQAVLQNYVALSTVSDNCDSNPIVTQSPPAGTSFTTSQTVTLYAQDIFGNIDSCSFLVVSNDITAPSISCPGNSVVYVNQDCEYIVPDFSGSAIASDNCDPSLTINQTPAVGSKLTGVNTNHFISLQAVDAAGNSSSCSFQVTLQDTLAPVFIDCKDSTFVLNQNCEFTLPNMIPLVGINENCGTYTSVQFPIAGTVINTPTTTQVVLNVQDSYGNTNNCVMQITTIDTTSPNIVSCPASATVSTGASSCDYTVPNYTPDVFAVDNCSSILTISQSISAGSILTGGSVNNIEITVSDASGNTSTCDFDITVVDLVAPQMICPSNPTAPVNQNCDYIIPSYDTIVSITDNCGFPSNYSQTPVAGTVISGIGTQQSISLFVEDDNNNSTSCSFTITLVDTTAPVISCPGAQSVTIDGNCQYQIPNLESITVFSDFCDANPTFSQSPIAGTLVTGIVQVTISVSDASGNTATCIVQTQPDDNEAPTISCPGNQSSCDPIFTFNTPFGNDNCGVVTVTQTDNSGLISGDTFPVGITTVEFTATDLVGNNASCSFDITVFPTPIITNVTNYTIEESDSVQLNVSVSNYDSLLWTPSFYLSDNTAENPWVAPTSSTTYTLTALSNEGCVSVAQVIVSVNQDNELIINNYLSPNGDGKNDLWTMNKPSLINGCDVMIYDRWAKLVWQSNAFTNNWDGTNMQGEPLPDGTYFYQIVCAGKEDLKGSILLMR